MNASLSRRGFLKSASTLAAALGTGSIANLLLHARPAKAADYKALVCVFLYGGNDGLNTIVPTDARYADYSAVRGALALPKSSLVALQGSAYGLHPSLSALASVWNGGKLAPVFNVGPLHEPLTKAQYLAAAPGSMQVPDRLFSHSDQQALWEGGVSTGDGRTGWGGRATAAVAASNAVISLGGSPRFGQSDQQSAIVLPEPGSVYGVFGLQPENMGSTPNAVLKYGMDALYAQGQDTDLADAYARMHRDGLVVAERLAPLVRARPGDFTELSAIDSAFAGLTANGTLTTGLAKQLYQAAKIIAARGAGQGDRQIFFAQLGGFDTHAGQVLKDSSTTGQHAKLLKELGDALAAFNTAMVNLGLADAVTTFTQSDFGRTFKPNSSLGTDHAWGNHHLVMGGAVKGKTTYGTHPELLLGGADDVADAGTEQQGRFIPTTSVDQYAATLLKWWGLGDGQLDAVLPNLANFGAARTLGFL